jgi:phosphoribosylformylglycinamidine synthase
MAKAAVIQFPGSNCDQDCLRGAAIAGADAFSVWHKQAELPACDYVVLPGGFSYGDYLRSGAIAARSPIMAAVRGFADRGGPVIGICNGFQILCEAGMLEGALVRNATLKFECRDVHLAVEGKPTPFTGAIPAGRILRMPIAHADGRYHHEDPASLEARGLVVFRYVDAAGGQGESANPNGSVGSIAGVANERGNVVGLMPHPDRACEVVTGGVDGKMLFDSVHAALAGARVRVGG